MRSLAARVKRSAATDSLGTSVRRTSSVTVDTDTIIFESRSGVEAVSFASLESEIGGRLTLERKRRWRIACENKTSFQLKDHNCVGLGEPC